jgi:hypothetical protein
MLQLRACDNVSRHQTSMDAHSALNTEDERYGDDSF